MDAGASTEAVLALGRKLAEHVENHDLLGHWMSHHLAELISAAEHEATDEARIRIVDTILRIWTLRDRLPQPPLDDFTPVLAALEYLGDTRPWAFSRLGLTNSVPEEGADATLVRTALALESLTREVVLRLIWLAARDADENNRDWLAISEEIGPTPEARVFPALRRLRQAVARSKPAEAASNVDPQAVDDLAALVDESSGDKTHVAELRAMAELLSDLADQFSDVND